MKTAVIIPTYNEGDNIETLVTEIRNTGVASHVIVVDDDSPDGTGDIADELARRWPEVGVIHRPRKMGLGTAYIAGFKRALSLGVERIVTMDADFSHHPRYLPDLVAGSASHDLVIGSRYVDGGGTLYCGFDRKFLSRGANTLARLALGLHARDCTAGFRCYHRRVLETVDLDSIFSNGYSFLIEMLYRCQRRGYRIGEVPIIFENRQRGTSKISRHEILKAGYTVLRLSWERVLTPSAPKSGGKERVEREV